MAVDSKICKTCGEMKSLDDYRKAKTGKYGRDASCKICANKHYRENGGAKVARALKLKTNFGMALEDYDVMFDLQNGLCAICGEPPTRKVKGHEPKLCIDHNHITGNVRALLCNNCNRTLGYIKEDTRILRKMIHYLTEDS